MLLIVAVFQDILKILTIDSVKNVILNVLPVKIPLINVLPVLITKVEARIFQIVK